MTGFTPAAIEEIVGQAWCRALGLAELPADANLFSLGGDSLTATMIAAELGDRLGAEISLSDLLTAPGFGEFVALVAAWVADPEGRG